MSTHETPSIQRWLHRHPRFTFHFTPTYSSWMNLVERWFAELTDKWLRRGTHHSVRQPIASIRTWVTDWNDDPKPFVSHKTADEILHSLATYIQRVPDSDTRRERRLVREHRLQPPTPTQRPPQDPTDSSPDSPTAEINSCPLLHWRTDASNDRPAVREPSTHLTDLLNLYSVH